MTINDYKEDYQYSDNEGWFSDARCINDNKPVAKIQAQVTLELYGIVKCTDCLKEEKNER